MLTGFTPVDKTLIPTGELTPVQGTPMDFTKPTAIGARINDDYEQLVLGQGYDHNWVINRKDNSSGARAALVHEPTSGRVLEVLTTAAWGAVLLGQFSGWNDHRENTGTSTSSATAFAWRRNIFRTRPTIRTFPQPS